MPAPDELTDAAKFHAQDLGRMRVRKRRPRTDTSAPNATGVGPSAAIGPADDETGRAGRRESWARQILRRILGLSRSGPA